MIPVLIIGAGPAGLAVAARLLKAGVEFEIIEKEDVVASKWRDHYDRLHLHTTKGFSYLPFRYFDKELPMFVSKFQYHEYAKTYALKVGVESAFGEYAVSIESMEGAWNVRTNKRQIEARSVVVATGINHDPKYPEWVAGSKIPVVHAAGYKNPSQFDGKRFLVVGFGNSGAEIALDLAENGKQVWCSIRSEVNVVPLKILGRSTQATGSMLEKFPFGLGDKIGKAIARLAVGDLSKYGLRSSSLAPAQMLREKGRTPMIDLGTVKMIRKGKIKVIGDISQVDEVVHFKNGQELEVDHIICATGYNNGLSGIIPGIEKEFDQFGQPSLKASGAFTGLYFPGFDNHHLGGILKRIREESELITDDILHRIDQAPRAT